MLSRSAFSALNGDGNGDGRRRAPGYYSAKEKIEVSIEGWDMSRRDSRSVTWTISRRVSIERKEVRVAGHVLPTRPAKLHPLWLGLRSRGTGICDKWRNFFVPADRFFLINGLIGASPNAMHLIIRFILSTSSFRIENITIQLLSILTIWKLLTVSLKARWCLCYLSHGFDSTHFLITLWTSSFMRWKIAGCKFSRNTCSKYTVFRWNFGSLVLSKSGTHMHACQRARFSQLQIYWRIRMCYGLCTAFGLKTKYIMHRRKCIKAIINGETQTYEYNYENKFYILYSLHVIFNYNPHFKSTSTRIYF